MTDPTASPTGRASRRWGDLGVRAASGVVLIVAALLSVWFGGLWFLMVWSAAALAVLYEWLRLPGVPVPAGALAVAIVGFGVVVLLAVDHQGAAAVALLGGGAVQASLGTRLNLWAASGQLYAGAFLLAVVTLRFSTPDGGRAIIWLFATVWSTDIFAYFGGRLIGGPRLWPRVSPSKTWSGTLTGVVAGALIGTFVAADGRPAPVAVPQILALSLAAAILSQLGDAFESAVKRRFGVKDSGRLIPGHGGAMDRLDGFIAAAIFAVLVGELHRRGSVASGLFVWT